MLKEKAREERLKEQMEAEIRDKDQQLLELMSSQTQVCRFRVLCHASRTMSYYLSSDFGAKKIFKMC